MRTGLDRRPAGGTSLSPATGRRRSSLPPSRVRSDPATRRRGWRGRLREGEMEVDVKRDAMTAVRVQARFARPKEDTNMRLEESIASAAQALCALQRPDGHFVFELEADATIPAEYVLMRHYRGEPVDSDLEGKIACYLRRIQSPDGGWPLFHAGASDVSASVKAYFALKMIGDRVDRPHMARARNLILAKGGAANSNVFTRNLLALYGVVPWR